MLLCHQQIALQELWQPTIILGCLMLLAAMCRRLNSAGGCRTGVKCRTAWAGCREQPQGSACASTSAQHPAAGAPKQTMPCCQQNAAGQLMDYHLTETALGMQDVLQLAQNHWSSTVPAEHERQCCAKLAFWLVIFLIILDLCGQASCVSICCPCYAGQGDVGSQVAAVGQAGRGPLPGQGQGQGPGQGEKAQGT